MTISLPVVMMALALAPAPSPQRPAVSLAARSMAPWTSVQPRGLSSLDVSAARQRPGSFQPRGRGSFRGGPARRVTAIIVGTVIGAVAGGLTGAALEADSGGDSPGLGGFVVGAPIGAAIGGITVAVLTR
jgi:hypothetical protein